MQSSVVLSLQDLISGALLKASPQDPALVDMLSFLRKVIHDQAPHAALTNSNKFSKRIDSKAVKDLEAFKNQLVG